MDEAAASMVRLSDSSHRLADPGQDIRGRKLVDRDGDEIGEIDDLLIEPEQGRVRMIRVKDGGLFGIGGTPLYIPAEFVADVTEDLVAVDRSRVQVAGAPTYDPELIDGDQQMAGLYEYYGATSPRRPDSPTRTERFFT
ncbi:PRC-barrel domain-containing protein [Actinoplanes solisilvae]|uniref:PRC-barrel domain-containing protein n=1 Tax=Actinoplanes solisilvae TaxID=2486853 RepID=UPI000FD6DD72|nr:PRC-barrel domain-containing protein [Actinoplanes solisilvae]